MSPLRVWAYKSPVPSCHLKIAPLERPNSKELAKRLLLVKILRERLFFYISSSWTPIFGGKKHWLLVIDDNNSYACSFFLKEKFNLADVMLGLIKNLKNKYNLQVQYLCCNNARENIALKTPASRKSWGWSSNIQPQVSHNIMAMLNKNLLPFSTSYVCAMLNGGKFNAFFGQSCKHCHASWKLSLNSE